MHRTSSGKVLHGGRTRCWLGVEPAKLEPLRQGDIVRSRPTPASPRRPAKAWSRPPGKPATRRIGCRHGTQCPPANAMQTLATLSSGPSLPRSGRRTSAAASRARATRSRCLPASRSRSLIRPSGGPVDRGGGPGHGDRTVAPPRSWCRRAEPGQPDHQAVSRARCRTGPALGQLRARVPRRSVSAGCVPAVRRRTRVLSAGSIGRGWPLLGRSVCGGAPLPARPRPIRVDHRHQLGEGVSDVGQLSGRTRQLVAGDGEIPTLA